MQSFLNFVVFFVLSAFGLSAYFFNPYRSGSLIVGLLLQEGGQAVGLSGVDNGMLRAKKIDKDIFIIGGGTIYEQTIHLADKLEVTLVKADLQADTFFPEISPERWMKTDEICFEKDEKNQYDFCFQTYEKREEV